MKGQSKPQHQGSLEDQLDELNTLAAQNGLYDAQDWLVRRRAPTTDRTMKLTEAQVHALYARNLIDHATWCNALRELSATTDLGYEAQSRLGRHAIKTCQVAIEALVDRAINSACAVIQAQLDVTTGDLAATILDDGTLERELTRYVHAELDAAAP